MCAVTAERGDAFPTAWGSRRQHIVLPSPFVLSCGVPGTFAMRRCASAIAFGPRVFDFQELS
jgi:hypothetical protein